MFLRYWKRSPERSEVIYSVLKGVGRGDVLAKLPDAPTEKDAKAKRAPECSLFLWETPPTVPSFLR